MPPARVMARGRGNGLEETGWMKRAREGGGGMNETYDRSGPAVAAACRARASVRSHQGVRAVSWAEVLFPACR